MKTLILSAIAFSVLATPVLTPTAASAQGRQELREDRREFRQERREDRREFRQERREDRREFRQDRRADRPSWLRNGGRYGGARNWIDHRRYGLRAPGRGQRWVRYDDNFLLVTVASGLIGAVIVVR